MLGLRTQGDLDDKEFCRFFEIVQNSASKKGCVFFLDTSEGNEKKIGDVVCEDLSGWLVPDDKVDAFIPVWESWGDVDAAFFDLSSAAEWKEGANGVIDVGFRSIALRL